MYSVYGSFFINKIELAEPGVYEYEPISKTTNTLPLCEIAIQLCAEITPLFMTLF